MPSFFSKSASSFNTASGRYYCNSFGFLLVMKENFFFVSIPQAVGTIAIYESFSMDNTIFHAGFNTASGRYYCNAVIENAFVAEDPEEGFNTASGRYYCNHSKKLSQVIHSDFSFNTASGRYYCNSVFIYSGSTKVKGFQYRKR